MRIVAVPYGIWLALQSATGQGWDKIVTEAAWDPSARRALNLRIAAMPFGFWLAFQPAAAQDRNKIMAEAAWDWRPGDLVFLNDVNAFDDLI